MTPVLRALRGCIQSARYARYSTLPSEAVIFMEDDMVVCWHPEQPFPYECSLPLPASEEKLDTSILRIGHKDVADVFRKKEPFAVIQELSKITYTTKHRWFPKSRLKKAKKTPPNRPYL